MVGRLAESRMRRTDGWAASIGLAAISRGTLPHPDQFVTELTAKDSALTNSALMV
jgi:hypothetical protein